MTVKTIIFGPTGGVGGFVLQHVASQGAHVTLAMRDPSKSIPGLSSAQESAGNFTRVKADLTDPASVSAAASQTKPHSAFIYQIHGPEGVPKASIEALKDAGVQRVVFLSSYSVEGNVRAIPQSNMIPWAHAQTEIKLEDVFGQGNFTAVRPAWFASNAFRYVPHIKKGLVREIHPDNLADWLAPKDIGDVCGSLMVREQGPLPQVVDLAGQQVITLEKVLHMIAKVMGKEVEVEEADLETGVKLMQEDGMPEPLARFLAKQYVDMHNGTQNYTVGPRFEKAQKTVKELVGRDGLTIEQWVEENKSAFA